MLKRRIMTVVLVALSLSALASSAFAGTYAHDRNGWSIGFGVGGGSAGLSIDGGGSSDRESGAMGNFRVGYPVNEQFALALEGNGWSKSEDGTTVTFSATTIGGAFYPAEGWVLRGGVGLGSTTASFDTGSSTVSETETGLGLHGGVGYEFRLARTFAIGPQFDAGYTTFDGGSANWFGVGVNLNWYFIPQK